MINRLARVALALVLSGFGAATLFLVIFGDVAFLMTTLSFAWPVVLLASLILGGACYALLRWFNVSLTLPVCTATGVVVSAASGVLLIAALNLFPYRGVDRHAENPEALRWHRDLTLPLDAAAVGAVGGLIFASSGRLLRIR